MNNLLQKSAVRAALIWQFNVGFFLVDAPVLIRLLLFVSSHRHGRRVLILERRNTKSDQKINKHPYSNVPIINHFLSAS